VLIVGCLSRALKLRGSRASEVSLSAHHKHHRTLNWKIHGGRWIYGPHSLLRSMVDRSFGTLGFDGFQSTSQQISRSVELVNSRSGVDQWSTTSQHPTTDIYYGTLGFRSSRLSILSILLKCQVSRLLHLFPSVISRSMVEINSGPPGFRSSGLQDFGASGFWDFRGFHICTPQNSQTMNL
jgi:hypothetical protein